LTDAPVGVFQFANGAFDKSSCVLVRAIEPTLGIVCRVSDWRDDRICAHVSSISEQDRGFKHLFAINNMLTNSDPAVAPYC